MDGEYEIHRQVRQTGIKFQDYIRKPRSNYYFIIIKGDRIGMMRKANGNLHFYINGLDQGVAATRVGNQMWGVVDLYGMTVKVTIVDRDERDEQNLITRRNVAMREHIVEDNRLLFHSSCGSHAGNYRVSQYETSVL